MKYKLLPLLFLLMIPIYLIGKEIVWKSEEGDFFINIVIVDSSLSRGEPLQVKIQSASPLNYEIDPVHLIGQILQHANPLEPRWYLNQKKIKTESDANRKTSEIDLNLIPLSTGILNFSLFNIHFFNGDGGKDKILYSPIFTINVSETDKVSNRSVNQNIEESLSLVSLEPQFPIDPDRENLEYLFSPERLNHEKIRNRRIADGHAFPIIPIIILLACVVAGILLFYFKPFINRNPIPGITPQDKALKALNNLVLQKLPEQGSVKEFYSSLTSIVRVYLEEKYKFLTLSQTTDEFLHDASLSTYFPEETKPALANFLKNADQVKFAGKQASESECLSAYESAMRLIYL